MDPARWKKIDELIDAALELPEHEREAFVSSNTGDDDDLRTEVLHLLAAQKEGDNFMLKSAMKVAAKAMAEGSVPVSDSNYINKSIATYKIERRIGAGGMGEVYLA